MTFGPPTPLLCQYLRGFEGLIPTPESFLHSVLPRSSVFLLTSLGISSSTQTSASQAVFFFFFFKLIAHLKNGEIGISNR